jgi:hypothetical protein
MSKIVESVFLGHEWPKRCPIHRVLVASALSPFLSLFAVSLLWPHMIAVASVRQAHAAPIRSLLNQVAYSFVFAAPGYVSFLILGIPTLLLLYRSRQSNVIWFILAGCGYALVAGLICIKIADANSLTSLTYIDAALLLMLLGAIAGLITWSIMFLPFRRVRE